MNNNKDELPDRLSHLRTIDHLSIWEIAHRWHDFDPNQTDPKKLPLPVQDTLRLITRLQAYHQLPVLKESGVEVKNDSNLPKYEDFIVPEAMLIEETVKEVRETETGPLIFASMRMYEDPQFKISEEQRESEYEKFCKNWSRVHNEYVKDFDLCYKKSIFNKGDLEKVHLDRPGLLEMCDKNGLEPPTFWFTHSELESYKESQSMQDNDSTDEPLSNSGRLRQDKIEEFWNRLAPNQKSRLLCRSIAKALWSEDETLTIADIIKHEAIQQYGDGRYYKNKDTIRDWIKDLDPRSPEEKTGRPKGK